MIAFLKEDEKLQEKLVKLTLFHAWSDLFIHLVPGRHSVTILAEEIFAVLIYSFGFD